MIRVIVNGANGRMGKTTVGAIEAEDDLTLVAQTTRKDSLADAIVQMQADVVVDFTQPDVVFDQAKIIIEANAHPVIGTTGLTPAQITTLQSLCEQKGLGGIIAPNFSLGAILMMRYAQDAAKYFPAAEIIELHHDKKRDAPSGTAIKTAELMANAQKNPPPYPDDPARGDIVAGTPIHSVRLPGLFAHQAVIFGGEGETLTLRHDATDRSSMMPGVILACRKVVTLNRLIYGLDQILD